MKKIYTLLFTMLLAFVGTGSAWGQMRYTSGQTVDLTNLQIDDIIEYGVNFDANGDDFFLAFFASEAEIDDDNYENNRIRIDYENAMFDESNGLYANGNKYRVAAYKGYDWDTWFAHIYYLVLVDSSTPSGGENLNLNENSTDAFVADTEVTYDQITVARTIGANVWSTFCMPFAMTKAQLDANLGSDAEIKRFNRLTVEGDNLTLSFSDIDKNLGTTAGAAYMVRTKKDVSEIIVKNVQTDAADYSTPKSDAGYSVKFCRTLHKQIVPEGSFIISNNVFYLVDSEVYIKGFRGYFTVTGPASSAKKLLFDIDGENVTDIEGIATEKISGDIYDLQGRRVSNVQNQHLYIQNGRKVFIK